MNEEFVVEVKGCDYSKVDTYLNALLLLVVIELLQCL